MQYNQSTVKAANISFIKCFAENLFNKTAAKAKYRLINIFKN